MDYDRSKSTIERAFDLARSGECQTLTQIRRRLRAEGRSDVDGQLFGRTIAAQLQQLCRASRDAAVSDGVSTS